MAMDINIKPTVNNPDSFKEEKGEKQKKKIIPKVSEESVEKEKKDLEIIKDIGKGKKIDIQI